MDDMDLTVAKRAERNSDGVVFYKVMNGRAQAEDAGVQRRIVEGSGLVRRRLRADPAQQRSSASYRIRRQQLPDNVAHGGNAESHQEHVTAAGPDAAAGEETPRGADAEVREHADNERGPDGGPELQHEEGNDRNEGADGGGQSRSPRHP